MTNKRHESTKMKYYLQMKLASFDTGHLYIIAFGHVQCCHQYCCFAYVSSWSFWDVCSENWSQSV